MKNLTKTGESFIKTICSGTSTNTLISGKYRYNLPLSDLLFVPTTFTADIKDRNSSGIGNNAQLDNEFIYWFNKILQCIQIMPILSTLILLRDIACYFNKLK